jgi:serine protease
MRRGFRRKEETTMDARYRTLAGVAGTVAATLGLAGLSLAAPCTGRWVTTSLVSEATTPEVVEVAPGRVSLSSCGLAAARVVERPRGTRVRAVFRGCPGLLGPARLKALVSPGDCGIMVGTFRARRDGILEDFLARRPGSVAGRLAVAAGAVADADTADPAMGGDNDSIATAQDLPLEGTVGGAAGQGDGRLVRGEHLVSDVYRVALDGTPRALTLHVAEPEAADLDLFLVDADGRDLVPPSLGTGAEERVVTPSAQGTAFLLVATHRSSPAASSYVLRVAPAPADLPAAAAAAPAGEFVPGEIIVRFHDDAPLTATGRLAFAANDAVGVAGDARAESGALYRIAPRGPSAFAAGSDLHAETLAAVDAMRARPDVRWAQPNYVRRPQRVPNDPTFAVQWHYPLIGLPAAWDVTIGSPAVIVAVVDTGLLIGHPEIDEARLVPGFDFISDPVSARDGDGFDDDPFDVGDSPTGSGSSFHGTHVAGTIGAATDNGVGVAGVDWRARLMPLRALGARGGTDFDIAQAILFAAGLRNASGRVPAERADVINLSLGGPGDSPAMREAIVAARRAGAVVVAAAGNDALDASGFTPAAFPEVICVSAVDTRRARAPYSNFGAVVDVAAPGGDQTVDRNGDGIDDGVVSLRGEDAAGEIVAILDTLQGTSMAAPHVSGVLALMQAAFLEATGGQRLTPGEVDALLVSGALTDDLGDRGAFAGHGLVNAAKAVRAARDAAGGTPPPGEEAPAPAPGQDGRTGGDVGRVVVRLLDPETDEVLAESESEARTGYAVRFDEGLPAGRYRVLAGTDRDADGRLDEAGEAFGQGVVEVTPGVERQFEIPLAERLGARGAK